MTLSNIFTPYGAHILPDGGALTMLGGITSQSIIVGSEHTAEPTAGATKAQHSEVTSIAPRGNITTFDVGKLIGLIGTEGACLTGGATEGFALYGLSLDPCGSLTAGSVHRKVIIPNGRIIPRSISVGHRQNAEMTAEVMALFDGTNDPIPDPTLVAAPTGVEDLFRYTLGDVQVGGVTLSGNTSIEINFGVEIQADGGDSDLYDTHLQIIQVKPEITITTRDVTKFGSGGIGLTGIHGTHANSSIVLRRRLNGTGAFSSAADSIEVTFDGLISVDQAFQAQSNQRGEMTVKITALDDGTNDPLVFDTAFDADGA